MKDSERPDNPPSSVNVRSREKERERKVAVMKVWKSRLQPSWCLF